MIYLSLSILSSIGIFLVFRLFKSFQLHTRQSIMLNYLVAAIIGLAVFRPDYLWLTEPWFLPSCLLGIMFYLVFRIMAKVTQVNGLSVSSIATKMSVVVPVVVGIAFLNESISFLKTIGIVLGLVSIILSAGSSIKPGNWIWPVILFLGSGVVDSSLKLFQHFSVAESEYPVFIANIFIMAFLASSIHHLFTSERRINFKTLMGGVALGMVNFTALYFILKTLALPDWESSLVFPINNFGIIAGTTLMAIVFFREKVTAKGWLGFALASMSILLLYLSK